MSLDTSSIDRLSKEFGTIIAAWLNLVDTYQ